MRTIGLLAVLVVGCGAETVVDEALVASPGTSGEDASGTAGQSPASAPASGPGATEPPKSEPPKAADVAFRVLSYNVAGLPEGVSKSHPLVNSPLISPKLNAYDLVVVQEDFSYHAELVSSATHAHKSTPAKGSTDLGDGLNTLSRFPFSSFTRTKWKECNGYVDSSNDCLTPKGYTRFVVDLGGGREVDVYDVHFDAGRSGGDAKARLAQVDQIALAIATQSKGRAVIVAGDTNMKVDDEPQVQRLLKDGGLSDACRTLNCPESTRIDRVMFRSSASVVLAPQKYVVESWLDSKGEPLSDHEPVSVDFVAKSAP